MLIAANAQIAFHLNNAEQQIRTGIGTIDMFLYSNV